MKFSSLLMSLLLCALASAQTEVTSMNESRYGHSMCLMDNGIVLITGGSGDFTYRKSAEIGESGVWNWSLVDDMTSRRFSHTSHGISGNRALIIGGWDGESTNHVSTEIYLGDIGAWEAGPNMSIGRSNHRSIVLNDGTILISGGYDGSNDLASCDLFDPMSGTISPTASMNYARSSHALTLLNDGRVLASGGFNPNFDFQMDECEIFDPGTGQWSVVASMHDPRDNHACVLMDDGRVMATGGRYYNGSENWFEGLDSYEIYDPALNTWSSPQPLGYGYSYHQIFNFENSNLPLIFGGTDHSGNGVDLTYNSTLFWLSDQWSDVWNDWSGTYRYAAIQIDNSVALVTGGEDDNRAWVFDTSNISVDEKDAPAFSVYPNPTNGILQVSGRDIQSLELLNSCGQVVLAQQLSSHSSPSLDLTGLAPGTYVLKITSTDFMASQVVIR
jgi:hypothetical protein